MNVSKLGTMVKSSLKPFHNVKPNEVGEVKRLSNFYTGKKANPLWVGGIAGAALLGANAKNSVEYNTIGQLKLATQRDMQAYGAPDVLMADGVGQTYAPRDLNASGSLVFGLHNMRRG